MTKSNSHAGYRVTQQNASYYRWRLWLAIRDMKDLFRKPKPMQAASTDERGPLVFCISMQRNGTTSVGKLLRDFGFRWAGWPASRKNDWTRCWYEGDFEAIFASPDFQRANAFEDSPWFLPDFYKVLFHRFPGSKFILFTRDPDAWFQSMIGHSAGNVIGTSRVHSKIYRRELEFFDCLADGSIDEKSEDRIRLGKFMKIGPAEAEHYKAVYRLHNTEVQDFFSRNSPQSLHIGRLEDPDKWPKLGEFLGVDIPAGYKSHANKSRR